MDNVHTLPWVHNTSCVYNMISISQQKRYLLKMTLKKMMHAWYLQTQKKLLFVTVSNTEP